MTSNDVPKKPGFRRTADDFLGTDPQNVKYEVPGEKLGQILDASEEQKKLARAAEERARYDRAAAQSQELSRISIENAVMIAGNPALQAVAEHTAAVMNQPKEVQTSEVASTPTEADNNDDAMTVEEVRALINQENNEASLYHGETGESVSMITDDPVTYARKHGIQIR